METRVVAVGFAFGFTGFMTLAIALSVVIGLGAEGVSSQGLSLTRLTPQAPAVPAVATAAPVPTAPQPYAVENVAPFGRLMPDGYYCGIGCPDEVQP